MRSQMIVNNGATLLMDSSDAGTMTSSFTIASGRNFGNRHGQQHGSVSDNPASIYGTICVFDEEVLRSVSVFGKIELERETTTLQTNGTFTGTETVRLVPS